MKRKLLFFFAGSLFTIIVIAGVALASLRTAKVEPINGARYYWGNVEIWVEPATDEKGETEQLYLSKDNVPFLSFTAEDNGVVSMSLLSQEGKRVLNMYSSDNSQQWGNVEYGIEGDSCQPKAEVLTDFNFDGQFDYKTVKVADDQKSEYIYFDNHWQQIEWLTGITAKNNETTYIFDANKGWMQQ